MDKETKKAYLEKLETEIREWDAEIEKLDARVDKLEAEEKLEYKKKFEGLRAKRDEVKAKLGQLQDASEDAWEDLKTGLEDSWNAVTTGLKNTWDKLSKSE